MTKATELAQLGGLVNVTGSGTATKVGIGTTVDISGGLSIKGTPIISNTGVWQGSTAGIQGAQGTNGVQGITDNGTGDYTINFTNAMADANYCFQANGYTSKTYNENDTSIVRTTTAIRMSARESSNNAYTDPPQVSVAIFR